MPSTQDARKSLPASLPPPPGGVQSTASTSTGGAETPGDWPALSEESFGDPSIIKSCPEASRCT